MSQPRPQNQKPWQPSVPLADVAQTSREKAAALMRALGRVLANQKNPACTAADLSAIGLADYEKEFGHPISARHLTRLLQRTLDRDGGALHFNRLELYLSDNPARRDRCQPVISLAAEAEFRALHEVIAAFKNPAAPTADEKSYFWWCAFESYEQKLAGGKAAKKLKRTLVKWLARHAPFLVAADSLSVAEALRINFRRKYDKWIAGERDVAAIRDGRAQKSGNFRAPELTPQDRDILIAQAVFNCGGRIAQAWREVNDAGKMSHAISSYYLADPSRKSYVPKSIAESVKHEVAALYDLHHGPRQHHLNGAHIHRDWSGLHSLDYWQGDDFTYPLYFKAAGDHGELVLTRGQTLLMIDLRTTRILGFVLIAERQYNANAIRTLITNVADTYGLPRKGFYFEHGTWEAKLLTGERNAESLPWHETRMGLTEFGLKFHHANLPRAKPVERVGGALQNLMEGLPAYVGRNEMVEKFERTQKMLQSARQGDAQALSQIMDHAEWVEVLARVCELYNAAPQGGKMTGGLSPDAAFAQFANLADPPVKFSPACRYLLAHQRRAVRVGKDGITFRLSKEVFNFRNVETSRLIGQTVLTWFNPEVPEILTVTDMNREHPFTIARTKLVPAMDAPPELLAQELKRIEQHQSHPKARYRVLKAVHALQFRPMLADRETRELGAEIVRQRAALEAEQLEQARVETKSRSVAGRLGMALPPDTLRRPQTADDLHRLKELLAEDASEKANP